MIWRLFEPWETWTGDWTEFSWLQGPKRRSQNFYTQAEWPSVYPIRTVNLDIFDSELLIQVLTYFCDHSVYFGDLVSKFGYFASELVTLSHFVVKEMSITLMKFRIKRSQFYLLRRKYHSVSKLEIPLVDHKLHTYLFGNKEAEISEDKARDHVEFHSTIWDSSVLPWQLRAARNVYITVCNSNCVDS